MLLNGWVFFKYIFLCIQVKIYIKFIFRCPTYSTPISSIDCIPILYCAGQNPCYSGGTCIELNFPGTFRCKCPPGWTGKLCNQQAVTEVAQGGVTTELLVIIFVSIFAVLCKCCLFKFIYIYSFTYLYMYKLRTT